MSESASKSAIRGQLRQELKRLTVVQRREASAGMAAHLRELELWKVARRIYAFSPLPVEPDLTQWDWSGKSLALPRITASGLVFHEVPGFLDLPIHPFGMAEPPADSPIAPRPDLVLIPGLAFDSLGHRLGRGGGYYDRFLATLPMTTARIGVGFACQVRNSIPTEPHDVRMDAVVTELGVSICGARQNLP